MPWPKFFGGRRHADVLKELQDVKAAADRIETQLAETQVLSNKVSGLASSVSAISEITRPPSRRSIKKLLVATSILILGGFGLTVWGLAGFSDPAPDFPQYGSAQIFIQTSDKNEMAAAAGASARVVYYPEHGESARYTFLVPRRFAGRRFYIALDTSATLRNVKANFTITSNHNSRRCPKGDDSPGHPDDYRRCQLVAGVVPETAESETWWACSTGVVGTDMVPIEVRGNGRFETHSDWAHRQIEVPVMLGWYRDRLTSTWGGQDLGSTFATPSPTSCAYVAMRTNHSIATLESSTTRPKAGYLNSYVWDDGDSNTGAVFTTRSTYAAGLANFTVAAGAAIAAVGIGFIPVLYEKIGRYRSAARLS